MSDSFADVGDRHRRRTAFAMVAMCLLYVFSAAEHVAGAGAARYLDGAIMAMAVVMLGLLIPVMIWKLRHLPGEERHLYFHADGYVADTVRRAQMASWNAAFLLLVAMAAFADRFPELPAVFFLQTVVAIMLGVFALVFLFLDRAESGRDELERVTRA